MSFLSRCRDTLHALGLLALLVMCAPPAFAGPGVEAGPGDTAGQLESLERRGAARPREAAASAAKIAAGLPAGGAQQIHALMLQGNLLAGAADTEGAEQAALALDQVAAAHPERRSEALAAAQFVRGRVQIFDGSLQRARQLFEQAASHVPAQDWPLMRWRLALAFARVAEDSGRREDAVRHYLRALEIADTRGIAWWRAETRRQLAWLTAEMGEHERAKTLNREALQLATHEDDRLALSSIMNTEGYIQGLVGDKAAELRAITLAIEYARAANAPQTEALMLANSADYYVKSGQFAVARAQAERALQLGRALNDRDVETVALSNRGLALIGLRQFAEGKHDLAAAFALEEQRGSVRGMATTLEEGGHFLEQAGDRRGALDSYLRWRPLADQLEQRDQQKAVLELQEHHDHGQRQRELALLNAGAALQHGQLQAQSLQTRVWVLATVTAALALVLVALLARRVRESNRALALVNERLLVESERDPLTGLANRHRFQAAMRQHAADGRLLGSIFLIDIDHFKRINDRFGHAAGDQVLIELARRLSQTVRGEDLVVRWGGEEFLVVARDMSADAVEQMAQRVLDAIAGTPVDFDGHQIGVSASVGYATFPLQPSLIAPSWERAIDLVDTALYLAKAHGRNRGYGVRTLHADEAELSWIARSPEQALREGRVGLTLLHGPRTQGEAA